MAGEYAHLAASAEALYAGLEAFPVVASVMGAVVFGEPMSAMTLAGIVCVLAGVFILR